MSQHIAVLFVALLSHSVANSSIIVCRNTRLLTENISTVTTLTDNLDQNELEWCWDSDDAPPRYVNVTFAVPVVVSRIDDDPDSAVMRFSVLYWKNDNEPPVFYQIINSTNAMVTTEPIIATKLQFVILNLTQQAEQHDNQICWELTIQGCLMSEMLTCTSVDDTTHAIATSSSHCGSSSLVTPDHVTITVTEHIRETNDCPQQQQQLVAVAIAVPLVVLIAVLIPTGGALLYCCWRTIRGKTGMKKSPTILQYNNTPLYSERMPGVSNPLAVNNGLTEHSESTFCRPPNKVVYETIQDFLPQPEPASLPGPDRLLSRPDGSQVVLPAEGSLPTPDRSLFVPTEESAMPVSHESQPESDGGSMSRPDVSQPEQPAAEGSLSRDSPVLIT